MMLSRIRHVNNVRYGKSGCSQRELYMVYSGCPSQVLRECEGMRQDQLVPKLTRDSTQRRESNGW